MRTGNQLAAASQEAELRQSRAQTAAELTWQRVDAGRATVAQRQAELERQANENRLLLARFRLRGSAYLPPAPPCTGSSSDTEFEFGFPSSSDTESGAIHQVEAEPPSTLAVPPVAATPNQGSLATSPDAYAARLARARAANSNDRV